MRSDSIALPKSRGQREGWHRQPRQPAFTHGHCGTNHAGQSAASRQGGLTAGNLHQQKLLMRLIFLFREKGTGSVAQNYMKNKAFKLLALLITWTGLPIPLLPHPEESWHLGVTFHKRYQSKQEGTRLVNTHCARQHMLYPSAFFKPSAAEKC